MFLHAERNMDTRVKNDSMEHVVGNRHLIVGNTGGDLGADQGGYQYEEVVKDKHLHIEQNHYEKIDQNMQLAVLGTQDIQITGQKTETLKSGSDLHVTSNRREQIDGNDNLNVGGNLAETISGTHDMNVGGTRRESVGGDENVNVGGNRNEQIGSNLSTTIGQNRQETIGQNLSVGAGQQVYINGGMNVVIEAGMSLTLLGPGGFITIDAAGVSIQGTMVLINSGGGPVPARPPPPHRPHHRIPPTLPATPSKRTRPLPPKPISPSPA